MFCLPTRCVIAVRYALGSFVLSTAVLASSLPADIRVLTEASTAATFSFDQIPAPATNDLATTSTFRLIAGDADTNSGSTTVLHDGLIPKSDDEPRSNFFFKAETDGGFLEIDLGKAVDVSQIATYSWHAGARAAQVYRVYGSDGVSETFTRNFEITSDPIVSGWKLIASVDSRSRGTGGQHAVSITDSNGAVGRYRYLLFSASPTEKNDAFGNTFFSEIDVFEVAGPEPQRVAKPSERRIDFKSSDGKYEFTVDVTRAVDLAEWSESTLRPVVEEWYPKIVEMFPSDGFNAPRRVRLRYLPDSEMRGIPAYASDAEVTLNADWFRREMKREALGAVVHELVHVVQAYRSGERRSRRARTPGWIVEGIPDYVRWFLYEPESHGAEITARSLASARYDGNYRISANFLNWVAGRHGEKLIVDLNAAARDGKYQPSFWNEQTGKSEVQLNEEWLADCKLKIEAQKAAK